MLRRDQVLLEHFVRVLLLFLLLRELLDAWCCCFGSFGAFFFVGVFGLLGGWLVAFAQHRHLRRQKLIQQVLTLVLH